jgi:hypothetical protein
MLVTEIEAHDSEESQKNFPNINRTIVFEKAGRQELFEKWLRSNVITHNNK